MTAEIERRRVQAEREARAARDEAARLRREALLADAEAWSAATRLRDFIGAVLDRAPGDRAAMGTWAAWALAEADLLDPLARHETVSKGPKSFESGSSASSATKAATKAATNGEDRRDGFHP